jgi:hypothetical protein
LNVGFASMAGPPAVSSRSLIGLTLRCHVITDNRSHQPGAAAH